MSGTYNQSFPDSQSESQRALAYLLTNDIGPPPPISPPSASLSAPLDPATNAQFVQLMQTMGFGIGSGAAHETGQQFFVDNMDCGKSGNPSCPSVSPGSGVAGTSVTITGSGFGAAQGTGQVWLGTLNGVVQSWSDTQVVALVAAGSASANAQVLQNGVISNAIPFTVNTLQLTSISPSSGSAGTAVTFTGSGFGASQGSGIAWLGSTAGLVVSWSDTQVVATVAPGAVTGIARVQQNGVWSNAFGFTVPSSGGGGSATMLSPSLINMAVGDTHTIQASNAAGQPVTGLTWTTSDSTVVSLSTDDPPILTALAVGHVTITAGSASADVTVMAGPLALGTVLWSNPGDGSDVNQILPAVPSPTGVADVFAIQDSGNTVQAITSDGTTAWVAAVSGTYNTFFPDFQGGLGVMSYTLNPDGTTQSSIMKLDGLTGQAYPAYSATSPDGYALSNAVPHPDGTIFALNSNYVVGIDPMSGGEKFRVPISEYGDPGQTQPCGPFLQAVGGTGLIVAGDGYAYLPYSSQFTTIDCSTAEAYVSDVQFSVLQVDSSGGYTRIPVAEGGGSLQDPAFPSMGGEMITNADNGILLSWSMGWIRKLARPGGAPDASEPQPKVSAVRPPTFYLGLVSGGGYSTTSAGAQVGGQASAIVPVLQAQDGSFVGTVTDNQSNQYMVAFDSGGGVRWTVPNEIPEIATDDGGVIGQSGITYDQNGSATGQTTLFTQSWLGNEYQDGPVTQRQSKPPQYANSYAAVQGGNLSTAARGGPGAYVPSLGSIFRAAVASRAKGYVGNSTDWNERNNNNTTTCNLFVRDVLIQTSMATDLMIPNPVRPGLSWYQSDFRHPFLAADWANPLVNGGCWKSLTAGPDGALPGDVIATGWPTNGNDGTGHVGIVVAPDPGAPTYVDASAGDIPPYFWTPAQQQGYIPGTITLTDYGFRLPGFDPTNPQDVQGLKQDSHIRRFSCY